MKEGTSSSAVRSDETSVAVVIPVYNGRETIGRAIESAKAQTRPPDEIAVVDDGSTDGTREFIETQYPHVTLVTHGTNRGGSAARNSGIEATSSEVIAYLDADDEWKSQRICDGLERLEKESAGAVYCDFERVRTRFEATLESIWRFGRQRPSVEDNGDRALVPKILSGEFRFGGASTLMVTRKAHLNTCGWDERFERHQDWQYMIDLLQSSVALAKSNRRLVRKYEVSSPSGANVESASRLLRREYCEAVDRAVDEGFDVEHFHRLNIVRAYLREGNYRAVCGKLGRVQWDRVNLEEFALLLQAAIQGLSSR